MEKQENVSVLEADEAFYRLLVEYANDALLVLQGRKVVYQNPAHIALLGYTTEEFEQLGLLTAIAPEDRLRVNDYYHRRLRGEAVPEQYEIDLLTRTGRRITAEVKPRVITYRGQPATLVVIRDITARKLAEKVFQEAHQHTVQLLAAIPSILIGLDTHTAITWWNTTAEQMLGLTMSKAMGQPVAACAIPWDSKMIGAGIATCQATRQPVRVDDLRFQRPDGSKGFLGITVSPILDTDNGAPHFLLMGADITSRKLLEAQLVRAQKLESIGQLAAGIAHEINTPTQYVADNTLFLQTACSDLTTLLEQYAAVLQASKAGSVPRCLIEEVEATAAAIDVEYLLAEIPHAIQQSLEGLERVTTIVRAMKDFSHPGKEDKTAIDLNKAIESTITVARNEWKYVANMVTDFAPDLPLVPCLPGELNQVVLNLIVNAAHAIADVAGNGEQRKGTITLGTRMEGAEVVIWVSDTGTGIPAEIRDKIFDPFFTTKEVGKGTGQGLAIAHDVVAQKHGGTITFETVEGHGTTFLIRLPVTTA